MTVVCAKSFVVEKCYFICLLLVDFLVRHRNKSHFPQFLFLYVYYIFKIFDRQNVKINKMNKKYESLNDLKL